jgi:Tfp pilus assembly protein PilF
VYLFALPHIFDAIVQEYLCFDTFLTLWHHIDMIQPPDNLSAANRTRWQSAIEIFQQGYQLQRQGDWAGAIYTYKRSLALYPTAEAHTYLGWVYSFLNLYNEAIAECQHAIKVDPSFGNPYNDIGAYLIEQDKINEAIPWLEQAIQAPRYATPAYPHFNLGRAYEQLGQWHKAIDAYTQATQFDPAHQESRQALRSLQAKLN